MDSNKKYSSTGYVWGHYWGGGQGGYKAAPLFDFDSEEDLIKRAEEMLKEGSLDGGMGYEALTGALLTIKELDIIYVNGKDYTHEEEKIVIIGKLSKDSQDILLNAVANI